MGPSDPPFDMAPPASGTYPMASALKALQRLCHRRWASDKSNVLGMTRVEQLDPGQIGPGTDFARCHISNHRRL